MAKNESKTINWICAGIAAYFAGITIAGAIKRRKGIGKINPNRNGTRVIFKKFPDGDVIAFFPDEKWSYGQCASYVHMGQHGGADYGLIRELKPAKPNEYAPLLRELEYIGYDDLIIAHRV